MSKVTIKTTDLQNLVSIAGVCATNNQFSELSSFIDLVVKDNLLTISTTDGNNYLYVYHKLDSEDFSVCIKIDQFFKLIPKLTSDFTTLEKDNNNLKIISNGTYIVPTVADEMGNPISITNKLKNFTFTNGTEISTADIAIINKANKNAISRNNGIIEYTGYYFDNNSVITTDGITLAKYDKSIFSEVILLNASTFDLLTLYNDNFNAYIDGDNIIFKNDKIGIFGSLLPGKENYQINEINNLFSIDTVNSCTMNKKYTLDVLSRLSIFTDKYDMDFINIHIENEKIKFSTKNNINFEEICLTNSTTKIAKDFSVDIVRLSNIINQLEKDIINLYYGDNQFIKIIENNITQLLAVGD